MVYVFEMHPYRTGVPYFLDIIASGSPECLSEKYTDNAPMCCREKQWN